MGLAGLSRACCFVSGLSSSHKLCINRVLTFVRCRCGNREVGGRLWALALARRRHAPNQRDRRAFNFSSHQISSVHYVRVCSWLISQSGTCVYARSTLGTTPRYDRLGWLGLKNPLFIHLPSFSTRVSFAAFGVSVSGWSRLEAVQDV